MSIGSGYCEVHGNLDRLHYDCTIFLASIFLLTSPQYVCVCPRVLSCAFWHLVLICISFIFIIAIKHCIPTFWLRESISFDGDSSNMTYQRRFQTRPLKHANSNHLVIFGYFSFMRFFLLCIQ